MITNVEIAENLYDVYKDLAASGIVTLGKTGRFEIISHPGYAWPNMIYPGQDTRLAANGLDIPSLSQLPSSADSPKLVVFGEEHATPETLQQLSSLRFLPATKWVNMTARIDALQVKNAKDRIKCEVIDSKKEEQWRDWASVVEPVLFRNARLDSRLFQYAEENGLFKLLTGYFEGQPVSTALLYYGKHPGFYMVATSPGFQGRGFAAELIRFGASIARSAGHDSIVLHSTQAGLEFYRKLGFQEYGKLLLYYKMH